MRRFVIAAALLGVMQTAQAADMPDLPVLRGSFPEGLSSQRTIWEGFYLGGQANYGSVVSNIPSGINAGLQSGYDPTYAWSSLQSPHANNTGFGGFAGYNSQWDDVVIGLEANYIHGRYNTVASGVANSVDGGGNAVVTNSRASVKIDDFGSLRVRAGYVAGSFLPYLFAGLGVGSMTVDQYTSATVAPAVTPNPVVTASKTNLVYGYSAGAGVDVMLIAGLFLRAEYEYQRVTSQNIDININSARAGLGYKF